MPKYYLSSDGRNFYGVERKGNVEPVSWSEAVDEAGHVIMAHHLNITILEVGRDDERTMRTIHDPSSVKTVADQSQFYLAGVAALQVMGIATLEAIHYDDVQLVWSNLMRYSKRNMPQAKREDVAWKSVQHYTTVNDKVLETPLD